MFVVEWDDDADCRQLFEIPQFLTRRMSQILNWSIHTNPVAYQPVITVFIEKSLIQIFFTWADFIYSLSILPIPNAFRFIVYEIIVMPVGFDILNISCPAKERRKRLDVNETLFDSKRWVIVVDDLDHSQNRDYDNREKD